MRTIRIKLYKFPELSKNAQRKAIENLYDINIGDDWWHYIYEDAEQIGLSISGFDLDRSEISGNFNEGANYTANKIIAEHGETCETYKTAKKFINDWNVLVEKYSDGKVKCTVLEENVYDFDNDADELEEQFRSDILEDYRITLRNEYEYQQTEAAIKETIEANEYEFTKDGNLS